MGSSRSYSQTLTTTSSNIVETFVLIPFVETSEMITDLPVQKTIVHNLRWSYTFNMYFCLFNFFSILFKSNMTKFVLPIQD